MTYVPTIDPDVCATIGECVEVAPQVFKIADDVATVIGTGPDGLILEAAQLCPSGAIAVTDDTTGQRVFP
jgi:ferredoxin